MFPITQTYVLGTLQDRSRTWGLQLFGFWRLCLTFFQFLGCLLQLVWVRRCLHSIPLGCFSPATGKGRHVCQCTLASWARSWSWKKIVIPSDVRKVVNETCQLANLYTQLTVSNSFFWFVCRARLSHLHVPNWAMNCEFQAWLPQNGPGLVSPSMIWWASPNNSEYLVELLKNLVIFLKFWWNFWWPKKPINLSLFIGFFSVFYRFIGFSLFLQKLKKQQISFKMLFFLWVSQPWPP